MRATEFIKEAYVNPPNPEGPYRDRLDPTTDIRGKLSARNPSGDISTRWGKPSEIDLNDFTLVPNTKLPKRKFHTILTDLKLVPSEKGWMDLEWGAHEAKYYHMPNNENEIVAIVKGAGAGGGYASDLYMRTDIWDSF